MNKLIDIQDKKSEVFGTNTQTGMSPELFLKLAYSELDIFTVKIFAVRNWGNEQTDRHWFVSEKKSSIALEIGQK